MTVDSFCVFWVVLFLFLHSVVCTFRNTISCSPEPGTPVNEPFGKERGIFPGRVVWGFNPSATSWSGVGKNNYWWEEKNLNYSVVQNLLDESVLEITGSQDLSSSWEKIFEHFNVRKNGRNEGYKKGEKIGVLVNVNGNHEGYSDQGNNGNQVSPQFLKALFRQLVHFAGVDEKDITLFEGTRFITTNFYDPPQGFGSEFPNINVVDNKGAEKYAKKVEKDDKSYLQFSDEDVVDFNKTKLPKTATSSKYIIVVDDFRGHDLAGFTMSGKIWFGCVYRPGVNCSHEREHKTYDYGHWCPKDLHKWVNVSSRPMNSYTVLVDLLGHPDLGGKGLIFFSDGMYGGPAEGNDTKLPSFPIKFQMKPFNGHWSSSIFVSFDPIALDSVAFDIIRNEPRIPFARIGCVDNYLHEGALADNPPSKTIYNPSGKKRLKSLGVHEHWNSAEKMMYSRNLGENKGIELIKIWRKKNHEFVENITPPKKKNNKLKKFYFQ